MSTLAVNTITNAAGGNTATINGMTPTADSLQGFRNRLINSDMRIDQRNNGALISPAVNGDYYVDRWRAISGSAGRFSIGRNAGGVTPPASFTNYLGLTSLSAYTVGASETFAIRQSVEGFNVADLGWGTANAQAVTLSFWARSSLTGTFGATLRNSAQTRTYPITYTINSANTWEFKSVNVTGDTSGTWLTDSGVGIELQFSIGAGSSVSGGTTNAWNAGNFQSPSGTVSVVGTNGATFYITGVQLEVGSVATPFERRPYGTELMLCQRYYYKNFPNLANGLLSSGFNASTTIAVISGAFPVQMRVRPAALEQSGTASDYAVAHGIGGTTCSSVPAFDTPTTQNGFAVLFTVASGLTAGQGCQGRTGVPTTGFLAWSAEL